MHIPDGYLSPQTYGAAYAIALPFWAVASRKLNRHLRSRQVPLLALSAAFCFVIMMFNVPIPGGTTGHAVGAVLAAVLLGPWAACIAVTIALIVQAVLFADGGITCIGANCLNMAVVMPFVGWAVYRAVAGRSEAASPRRWIGAAAGGYVGLNAAAVTTAVMFGIQPAIAQDGAGHALYAPYSLNVALPIMVAEHALLFGFVEALVTGLVVRYLQQMDPSLLQASMPPAVSTQPKPGSSTRKLWIGVGVLALLSPLGIILPALLNSGSAWGEWSSEQLRKLIGYTPAGMSQTQETWRAPIPDYALNGQADSPIHILSIYYVVSAVIGVAVLIGVTILISKSAGRRE